jgi:hypothetical protein
LDSINKKLPPLFVQTTSLRFSSNSRISNIQTSSSSSSTTGYNTTLPFYLSTHICVHLSMEPKKKMGKKTMDTHITVPLEMIVGCRARRCNSDHPSYRTPSAPLPLTPLSFSYPPISSWVWVTRCRLRYQKTVLWAEMFLLAEFRQAR